MNEALTAYSACHNRRSVTLKPRQEAHTCQIYFRATKLGFQPWKIT